MNKVQEPTVRKALTVEPTVRKTLTVATRRIHCQVWIGLVAAFVVMSIVVVSGEELKHVPPAAPTFTVLHSFAGPPTDGRGPFAGLLRDTAGNLYGTTVYGGAHDQGVVFNLSPTGTETILYSFHSLDNAADGAYPAGGLVRDAAGNLYAPRRRAALASIMVAWCSS
jgi:uncharacterized repeat protein (TIGR03803 family)